MKRVTGWAGLAGCLLALAGCGKERSEVSAFPADATPVAFAELPVPQSGGSELRMPSDEVVRTRQEWQAAWERAVAGMSPAPALPEVDFAVESVLLVALGQRPDLGFGLDISRVGTLDGRLYVEAVEKRRGEDCIRLPALSFPVAAVRVARFDGDVTFVHRTDVVPCD